MPSSSSVKMESSATASGSTSRKKSSSSGRGGSGQLTATEKRIWQAALSEPDHILTNDVLQSRHADIRVEEQMQAVNSLLAKSLFTIQKTQNGLQYQALSKSEAGVIGMLDSDEAMIFAQIREASSEGIWTKQLKNRTNLHQTIMTRCLKSLEGKLLIKAVKSVKFPTRKIYMLAELTPSLELSGGPWYTDNEMDTIFIAQMSSIIHKLISSRTWPQLNGESIPGPLFLASRTSSLPTSAVCLDWLRKQKVTPTHLEVEDVQSLLDVLVYDGKIEKIPCFASRMPPKRKSVNYGRKGSKRRGQGSERRSASGSESDSVSESGSESGSYRSNSGSASDSDDGRSKRTHKRKHSSRSKSSSKKSKHKSRSDRRNDSRSSSKRSRQSVEDNRGKNSSFAKSIVLSDEEEEDEDEEEVYVNGGSQIFVYRAIRPFYVKTGWTEIPCGHCPVFNFCEPGGPVNAEGCVYMRDWIQRCKASDIDGEGKGTSEDGNGRVNDIEDAAHRKSSNRKRTHREVENQPQEEEDDDTSLGVIPLGLENQEQDYDDYGGEEA